MLDHRGHSNVAKSGDAGMCVADRADFNLSELDNVSPAGQDAPMSDALFEIRMVPISCTMTRVHRQERSDYHSLFGSMQVDD